MLAQREDEFEPALVAVADRDRAAVECDGVADDREPEPRAAEFARAPLVHAVEPLEEVGQVLLLDSDAVVGHQDRALVGRVVKQADEQVAASGVGGGIVGQVAEDRAEERGASDDLDPFGEIDVYAQPLLGGRSSMSAATSSIRSFSTTGSLRIN